MHKQYDLTQPGGLPWSQDRLAYIQASYSEVFTQFANLGVSGAAPAILNGMAVTVPGAGEIAVSDGWFAYNGEVIPFTGSTVTPGGGVALVLITVLETPLTFNNGSTPNVVISKTASLTTGATVTDATHFPVTSLKTFQAGFGINGRETAWSTLALSDATGTITGSLYYKKNFITNQLEYRLSLTSVTPSDFSDAPGGNNLVLGYLPAGYQPSHQQDVMVTMQCDLGCFVPLNAGGFANSVLLQLTSAFVGLRIAKPSGAVSTLSMTGGGVVSLE